MHTLSAPNQAAFTARTREFDRTMIARDAADLCVRDDSPVCFGGNEWIDGLLSLRHVDTDC